MFSFYSQCNSHWWAVWKYFEGCLRLLDWCWCLQAYILRYMDLTTCPGEELWALLDIWCRLTFVERTISFSQRSRLVLNSSQKRQRGRSCWRWWGRFSRRWLQYSRPGQLSVGRGGDYLISEFQALKCTSKILLQDLQRTWIAESDIGEVSKMAGRWESKFNSKRIYLSFYLCVRTQSCSCK